MNLAKTIAVAASVVILLGTASLGSARPYGAGYNDCRGDYSCDYGNGRHMGMGGMGMGGMGGWMQYGQNPEFTQMFKDHNAAIEPKRQEIQAKRLELNALSGNPNVQPETITKLAQDIARLSGELRQANLALREQMLEKFGPMPAGAGANMPMRRGGHGYRMQHRGR